MSMFLAILFIVSIFFIMKSQTCEETPITQSALSCLDAQLSARRSSRLDHEDDGERPHMRPADASVYTILTLCLVSCGEALI